jgi:hypothetical protein
MLTRCAADDGVFVPWAGALVRRLFTQSARRPEALRLVGQNSKPLFKRLVGLVQRSFASLDSFTCGLGSASID